MKKLLADDFLNLELINYDEYIYKNCIHEYFGDPVPIKLGEKIIYDPNFSVDPKNEIPFQAEYDDLIRLHYLVRTRKVTTILEFGVGKSTVVFADALLKNKSEFKSKIKDLRRSNPFECHSVDNSFKWIEECKKNIQQKFFEEEITHIHHSKLKTGTFLDKICTYYDPLPNISPDLIYLDAPDQYSAEGDIRGISTKHPDRMPMAADILTFEHFLIPGTLIIVDGRTANARFLKNNLQRNWHYFHAVNFDQHFFELLETPLGIYNERQIKFCLGDAYFDRLNLNKF